MRPLVLNCQGEREKTAWQEAGEQSPCAPRETKKSSGRGRRSERRGEERRREEMGGEGTGGEGKGGRRFPPAAGGRRVARLRTEEAGLGRRANRPPGGWLRPAARFPGAGGGDK